MPSINEEDHTYQELFAVSVRFEADETSADKDQQTSFNLVKCTNIPLASDHPQLLVISTDDVHPGWTVSFLSGTAVGCHLYVRRTFEGRSSILLLRRSWRAER